MRNCIKKYATSAVLATAAVLLAGCLGGGGGGTTPDTTAPTTTPSTAVPPSPPTGLAAKVGTNQAILSWAAVSGATSYNVYYSTTPGVTVGGAGVTKVAGATSGGGIPLKSGIYYFVVTALNGGSESAPSSEFSGVSLTGGAVQKPLSLAGVVSTSFGYPVAPGASGSADGIFEGRFNAPSGITDDGTNLYVADTGNHTIRKVVIATGEITTLAGLAGSPGSTDGTGSGASFNAPQGVLYLSGSVYVADTGNHTIRKVEVSTGVVTTIAGRAGTPSLVDATGTSARFNTPCGLAFDGTYFYIADFGNNAIRRMDAGGTVITIAGNGTQADVDNASGTGASFNNPYSLALNGTTLYVGELAGYKVRQVATTAPYAVSTYHDYTVSGGNSRGLYYTGGVLYGSLYGFALGGWWNVFEDLTNNRRVTGDSLLGYLDSAGSSSYLTRFNMPSGLTYVGGSFYVADTNNNVIRKVSDIVTVVTSCCYSSTATTSTLAGANPVGYVDGTGTGTKFNTPDGVTTDGTNLYVADTANNVIRQIDKATGAVTTLAGTAGATGSTDGTGSGASFNNPRGITTDGTNLYVADTNNNNIRKVEIATGVVTTFSGTGSAGNTDGTGTGASFSGPIGITTDGTNLYVADFGNHTIRQIVIATGVVTTLAGTAGSSGSTDAIGTAALFTNPCDVTTDGTNLYVADFGNSKIRQISLHAVGLTPAYNVTTIASGFNGPENITTDGTNLYVADTFNHTIRQIAIATGAVTTLAGTVGSPGLTDGAGSVARFNTPEGLVVDGTSLYVSDTGNSLIRKIH